MHETISSFSTYHHMVSEPPASTLSQTQTSAGDSLYAVYLLSVIAPQPDIAHYVTAYAHLLEGTTYTAGTLDRDSVEKLQPYLQETDCTTFVETVLALARTAVKNNLLGTSTADN